MQLVATILNKHWTRKLLPIENGFFPATQNVGKFGSTPKFTLWKWPNQIYLEWWLESHILWLSLSRSDVFRIGISISFVHSSFLLRVAIRIIKVMRSSRIVISWVQIKAFEIASNGLSEMTKWTAARYFCFAFILHPTSCTPHITQNEMSRCRLMWASPNMIPFAALMIFVFPSKPLGSFTFRDQLHQRSTPLFRFDAY